MKPLGKKIQISIDKPTAGNLDLSSKASAVECGTVIAFAGKEGLQNIWIGNTEVKIGDKIGFKAWAIDVLTIDGETYYFIDSDSEGLCAII